MKNILMIGPSPNRIGGVSIHINRLCNLIKDSYYIDFIDEARGIMPGFFNLRSLNLIKYATKIWKADVIHIHSGVFILRLFHIIVAKILFRKNVVVSIHHDLKVEGHIGITKFFLKYCNCTILVSQEIFNSVYVKSVNCHYYMMPAFLPPPIEEEEDLPNDITNWIDNVRKDPNAVLLASNANGIKILNGADLYGIDMCIKAVQILNKISIRNYYLLLIVLNGERHSEILSGYQQEISQHSHNEILLLTTPVSFVKIMKASDIILRPTNTDGDSITVREALFLNKRVVASDCVERPKGTVVFKSRDINDFCKKVIDALNDDNMNEISNIDYKSFYINCYNNAQLY